MTLLLKPVAVGANSADVLHVRALLSGAGVVVHHERLVLHLNNPVTRITLPAFSQLVEGAYQLCLLADDDVIMPVGTILARVPLLAVQQDVKEELEDMLHYMVHHEEYQEATGAGAAAADGVDADAGDSGVDATGVDADAGDSGVDATDFDADAGDGGVGGGGGGSTRQAARGFWDQGIGCDDACSSASMASNTTGSFAGATYDQSAAVQGASGHAYDGSSLGSSGIGSVPTLRNNVPHRTTTTTTTSSSSSSSSSMPLGSSCVHVHPGSPLAADVSSSNHTFNNLSAVHIGVWANHWLPLLNDVCVLMAVTAAAAAAAAAGGSSDSDVAAHHDQHVSGGQSEAAAGCHALAQELIHYCVDNQLWELASLILQRVTAGGCQLSWGYEPLQCTDDLSSPYGLRHWMMGGCVEETSSETHIQQGLGLTD
eukprot:jgi/Chrzof1/8113/UNPLg00158.t1